MARITILELQSISDIHEIQDWSVYITSATHIVDTELLPLGIYNTQRLHLIELYLAAHLVRIQVRQRKSETVGDSNISYMGTDGMYLDSTTFGQTVKMLDTSGQMDRFGHSHARINFVKA